MQTLIEDGHDPSAIEGSAQEESPPTASRCNQALRKESVDDTVRWQVSHLGERVGEAAHPGPAPCGRGGAAHPYPAQAEPSAPVQPLQGQLATAEGGAREPDCGSSGQHGAAQPPSAPRRQGCRPGADSACCGGRRAQRWAGAGPILGRMTGKRQAAPGDDRCGAAPGGQPQGSEAAAALYAVLGPQAAVEPQAEGPPTQLPPRAVVQSQRAWAREGLARERQQRMQLRQSQALQLPSRPTEALSPSSIAAWAQFAAAGDYEALTAVARYFSLPPSDVPAEYSEVRTVDPSAEDQQQRPSPLQRMLSSLDWGEVAEADRLLRTVVAQAADSESTDAWLAEARELFLGQQRQGEAQAGRKVWRDPLLNQTVVRAGGIDIVLTDTMRDTAEQVADALELEAPVLLEGATGVGKTMLSHLALRLLTERRAGAGSAGGQGLKRFNLSASVEPEDLLFRWAADPDKGGAISCPQPLAEAAAEGHVILLDEMNLAREAVLNVIEAVIDHRRIAVSDPSSWGVSLDELKVHKDFRIIATQNAAKWAGFEGHREALSSPFLARFRRVPLPPTKRDDLISVVRDRIQRSAGRCTPRGADKGQSTREEEISHQLAAVLVDGHHAFSAMHSTCPVLDCVTVRDLLRWAESLPPISEGCFNKAAVAELGWLCYCARYADRIQRLQRCDKLLGPLKAALGESDISVADLEEESDPDRQDVCAQEGGYMLKGPFALLRKRLQMALQLGRPLLLLGPPGSGKARAVAELCRAEGLPLRQCLLTPNTETAALVGQYLPSAGGQVAWVRGCVSLAHDNRETLLLDNIDAAPAAVCERLNPVTECPPVWETPERNDCRTEAQVAASQSARGEQQMQSDHPVCAIAQGDTAAFRIIATCSDTTRLSPAFFNRFLVIAHGAIPADLLAEIAGVSSAAPEWLGQQGGQGLLAAVRMREVQRQFALEGARWVLGGTGPVPDEVPSLNRTVRAAQQQRLRGLAPGTDHEAAAPAAPAAASSSAHTSAEQAETAHPFEPQVRRGGALLSLGLPVLVRGEAGWGATALAADVARQHSEQDPIVFIANSESTTADLVCSPTLDGKGAPGPLLRAWRSGRVLIIEGADRLSGGLLAEIDPVLQDARNTGAVCAELASQVDRYVDTKSVAEGRFGIVAVARTKDSLSACQHLFVELPVPDPAEAWRRADRHSAPTLYQVLAKGSGLSEQVVQAAAYLPQMTPRVFVSVVQRAKALCMLRPGEKDHGGRPIGPMERDRHWANCCASWLLPALPPAADKHRCQRALGKVWKDYKVDETPRILQVGDRVRCVQWGLYCELQGSLDVVRSALGPPDEDPDGPDQECSVPPVSEQAVISPKLQKGRRDVALALKRALCSIAFAYSAQQTIMLVGPPSFKSFVLQLFGSILTDSVRVGVQLSQDTIAQDLFGSARPCLKQEEADSAHGATRTHTLSSTTRAAVSAHSPGGSAQTPAPDGRAASQQQIALEFEPAVVTVEAAMERSGQPCLITFEGAEGASGDLLGELGALLRERELLLEVPGLEPQHIAAQPHTAFCLVACPPAPALSALGGIAAHWCPAYGPDGENSILADACGTLPSGGAPAAARPRGGLCARLLGACGGCCRRGDPAAAESVDKVIELPAAKLAHCPLRERLRLAQLVSSLAAEDTADTPGPSENRRWNASVAAVHELFGPSGAARITPAAERPSACPALPPGECVGLRCDGDYVHIESLSRVPLKVRRVAMTKKEQRQREQEVGKRVHAGARTFRANLARVCLAAQHRLPIALQGPPGTGKTLVAEQAARLLGHDFKRVQLSQGTTDADIYGSLMPTCRGEQSNAGAAESRASLSPHYQWSDGVISGAIRDFNRIKEHGAREEGASGKGAVDKKLWLCLDEFNLAPHAVLQCLLPLLTGDSVMYIPQTAERLCIKDVVVIVTLNPASIGGGREPLPPSISSCLLQVTVEEMGCAEARDILSSGRIDPHGHRGAGSAAELDNAMVDALMLVHEGAATVVSKSQLLHHYPIDLRTIEAVVQCFGPLVRSLQQGSVNEQDARFLDVVHAVYCAPHPPGKVGEAIFRYVREAAEKLQVIRWVPSGRRHAWAPRGWVCWDTAPPIAPTEECQKALSFLATVQPSGRAVLVHGPPAAGKTTVLRAFARHCQRDLVVIPAHLFTDDGDLLGQVCVSGMGGTACATALDAIARHAQRVVGAAALHAPLGGDRSAQLNQDCRALGGPEEQKMRSALVRLAMQGEEKHKTLATGETSGQAVAGDVVLARHAQLLSTLAGQCRQLEQAARDSTPGQGWVTFHFVESALLHAALTGKWVLIEGIDRAPPNAVERLNPLLEAWASLDLPERRAVSRTTPRPLTPEDGIHPDFRLFATASSARGKLSASLLSRMLCIHLAAPSEQSRAQLLGLSRTGDGPDPAWLLQAAAELTALAPGEHNELEKENDRAARLRGLLHGIEMWQFRARRHDQGGLGSLVFSLLSALAGGQVTTQEAAEHAGPIQSFLQVLVQRYSPQPDSGSVPESGSTPKEAGTGTGDSHRKDQARERPSQESGTSEETPKRDKRAPQEEAAPRDKAGRTSLSPDLNGIFALGYYAAGQVRADVIISKQKAALLALTLSELWDAQPGTVLAEMLRCIRSSDPGRTGVHLRDKAAQLQETFVQGDLGPVELFLLWWYSTEGVDVDRVCGFAASPPKYEWVRATCGEVRQIVTTPRNMSVALFKRKKHAEITACPAGYEQHLGQWLGPIIVRGAFLTLEQLMHRGDLRDGEPAAFTLCPRVWQEYVECKESIAQGATSGEEPLHYEQDYKKKWGDTRNVGISYAMVGAMRTAAVLAEDMTAAGSMIKAISLLAHLAWPHQEGRGHERRRRLYRGIGNLPAAIASEYSALKEGDTIVFANPSSTSADKSAALGFIKGKPECAFLFDIDAPERAGVEMYVSQYPGEAEILLAPFATLVIEQIIPPGRAGDGELPEASDAPGVDDILRKATYVRARLVGCELFGACDCGFRARIQLDAANANEQLQVDDASLQRLTMESMLGQTVQLGRLLTLEGEQGQQVLQHCIEAVTDSSKVQSTHARKNTTVTIAELPRDCAIALDTSALERFEGHAEGKAPARLCSPAGREWDEQITQSCYGADVEQEIASALGGTLPACASLQRGPPATRGSRLHIRGLVRAIASHFTYRRIFVGRAQSGGVSQAAAMILVDISPGASQLALLSVLQRALQRLGIRPAVAAHSGNEVWCISPPGQQRSGGAGAALLGLFAARSQSAAPFQDCSPAVHFAASALAAVRAPAHRLLWLTQGDSGSFQAQQRHGSRRAAVLAGAQAADVEVVAICLKPEGAAAVSGNVHVSAHHAVTVSSLAHLPRALRRLATGDCDPLDDVLRTTAAEQLGGVRIYGAGNNYYGQLGVPPREDRDRPCLSPVPADGLQPLQGAEIAELHCGAYFVLLRTAQGDVLHAGTNISGQRGKESKNSTAHPQLSRVPLPAAAVSIAAGANHAAAVLADRSVHTWGNWQKLGYKWLGRGGDRAVPQAVPDISDAERVSAGAFCTFAHRRGGEVAAWGRNDAGQLCLGRASESEAVPRRVAALCGVPLLHLIGGTYHCIALQADGRALVWGKLNGRLADGSADWTAERGCLPIVLQIGPQVSVAAGFQVCGSVGRDGVLRLWGAGHGQQPAAAPLPGGAAAREVVCGGAGESTVFARLAGGEWAAMGSGHRGLPFASRAEVQQLRPLPEALAGCRRVVTGPSSIFALYLCAQ